jgi:hypothetical protein
MRLCGKIETLCQALEKIMSRALAVVGSAVLAAALSASVTPAMAGKGKGGLHIGIGIGKPHAHHHRHRRVIYLPPAQPRKVVATPVVKERIVVVRYEDGAGRVYDVASKVWFDGASSCWSGKQAWTFKNNAWFYGSHSWSQAGGTWTTNAPEAPATVDCASVPAFASKSAPTTISQSGAVPELIGQLDDSPVFAPKLAEPKVAGPTESPVSQAGDCKKYVPGVGEMVTVPCTL